MVIYMPYLLNVSLGFIARPFNYIKNEINSFSSITSRVALLSLIPLSLFISYFAYRKFRVTKSPAIPVKDFSRGGSSSSNDYSHQEPGPINFLSEELILKIFSHLDLASLGAVSRVNKEWQTIANEPHLWKRAIYKEIACTSETLAKCCGEKVIEGEDQQEEWHSLPRNIAEILKGPCPVFPKKRVIDTHILVHIPKTINGEPLTLNSLGLLAKKYFPETEKGYLGSCRVTLNEFGDKPIDESRWVLMTKKFIPKSRNRFYVTQKALIAAIADKASVPYEVPRVLEASFCMLVHYFKCKERLLSYFPWIFTVCQEVAQLTLRLRSHTMLLEGEVIVGNFVPAGLTIIDFISQSTMAIPGVVALRKL
jgi:hypothetical protein